MPVLAPPRQGILRDTNSQQTVHCCMIYHLSYAHVAAKDLPMFIRPLAFSQQY